MTKDIINKYRLMGILSKFKKDTPSTSSTELGEISSDSIHSEINTTEIHQISSDQSSNKSKKSDTKKSYIDDDDDDVDVYEVSISDQEAIPENLPADIAELPRIVREAVTFEDDPTTPILTFRFFLLSIIFIAPGAFLDTMNSYRTTSAAYSVFFVQIASHYVGKWLAKVLPSKNINLYFIKFNLNPGPWSIKENVLVTLAAGSGATGNMGTSPISLSELYYNDITHPAVAIFFMWCINLTGYAYAAIARNFLLYDCQFVWPQALMQTNLFNSMAKADLNSKIGSKQIKVFFLAILGMTIWEFFPEYIFPMTSSLAFLCWVAPSNPIANFIGSGMGGMGFLNISLDWSNITSSVMLSPYWTIVIQFIAFAFCCWILIPIAKWGNLTDFKAGLMSNGLFTSNGTKYPTLDLLIAKGNKIYFNETAYHQHGPLHMGAQKSWAIFFDYAAYISSISWIVLFGRKDIIKSYKRFKERYSKKDNNNYISISQTYTDRLNKLQSSYKDVPLWWYGIMFIITFITLITIFATGNMFIPWWTYLIALIFGAIIVTPLAWLYAISNFQLPIGTFNELLYGIMIQATSGGRHPAGASTYGAIAGDAWYRAQYMLQDQKIGHYMHIPPRAIFFSQIFGTLIGVPVNYGALRWILDTKREYLDGSKKDPLNQWTGQSLASYNTMAVQYVLVGPQRFFSTYYTRAIPFGFLFGAFAPLIIYILHKFFPKIKFNLWNVTVFCSTASQFYGNLSTGYLSKFIVGTLSMFYFFRYRHKLWKKYNYILAAAFDTGYNLAVLLIFIFFSSGKIITMPNWWGNNEKSVERCFANT